MNAACKCAMILLLSGLGPSGLCAQPPAETGRGQKRDNAVAWKPTASWQAARKAGGPARGPRLAILVSGEAQRAQALAVQALLEAEASRSWHGELLERAQLEMVLREQRLSAMLSDANAIKLGQLVQADYFLVVGLEAERLRCRVNHFPSTTVVVEFELAPSSEDRLAKQIALRAFRAMAERSREPNRLAVAIGSFLVDDPFSQFTDLDRTLHAALRDRLSKVARIDLAERFHSAHLLREFELARGGLVPSVMAQLTAPASDVLIVGDIAPTTKQKLDSKDVALAFHVRVVSPTGLFESVDVKFIQPKADASRAADQIAEAVKRALAQVPQTPKRQVNSAALAGEFQTLKQRIFRMLPAPPQKSGNFFERGGYRGPWQFGKPAEIERTLRALENALLLKGDDQQLLVCAVSLVYELAREAPPNFHFEKPSNRQKALLERSCDYIETALALDFNYNTRGIAYTAMTQPGYWSATPERIQPIVERIVRDGVKGGWFPHEVEYSRLTLVNKAPDIKTKIEVFRGANRDAGTKADARLRLLQALDRHYLLERNAKIDAVKLRATFDYLRGLADELVKENSACSRGMGRYLKASTSFHSEPPDSRWKSELLEAIDAIPAMAQELGAEFPKCNYSESVHHLVRWASVQDKSPASMELTRRYIARQVEIDNFRHGMVADSLLRLLPTLDGDKSRAEALQWLTRLLEQYTYGGSADFERMKLTRWRNHLQQSVSGAKMLGMDNLADISLDSGTQDAKLRPHDVRIKKVVSAFGLVWALRSDYSLQDRFGEVFVVAPTERGAARVKGLSPKVTDIVAGREQLAVASIDSGLALVDPAGKVVREFRPGNSPLPTPKIRTLATDGTRFFLGLPGRNDQTGYDVYFQYELDPQASTLKKTETKMGYHSYYQMRYDKSANRIVAQTWDHRFYEANGTRWTFVRTPVRDAIHRVTVADATNKPIFTNIGFDLNYVYDFALWQDRLVFATGNGLYVTRPGTDKLSCVVNELDLEFFSLCPVGDKLFVGTNRGLHRIDAKVLAQLTFHEGARKK